MVYARSTIRVVGLLVGVIPDAWGVMQLGVVGSIVGVPLNAEGDM
jgi:hypothetical protein